MGNKTHKQMCKVIAAKKKLSFKVETLNGRSKLVGVSFDNNRYFRSFAYISSIPYGSGKHIIANAKNSIVMDYIESERLRNEKN